MLSRPERSGLKPAPSSSSEVTRPVRFDAPAVGLEDAGDDLQQRALAAAVVPDQPERLAAGDVETDVARAQNVSRASRRPPTSPTSRSFRPLPALVIERESLGHAVQRDGGADTRKV